jgi:TetR/AcrR family transcriptional regulator
MIPPSFINIPIELIYFMARVPPARLPGRPQSGTGDQEFPFRERLLDAARDLFATRGYAATSMRQVALGAGVTPALAHYYFKDKAGLSEAVLRERIAPLVNGIEAALEAHGADAVTALAGFVQQFTQVSSRHPWLPQLLLRELADAVGPATPVMRPLAERLHSLVAAGQASRAIRSDLRAEFIVLSVLSQCAFPFLVGKTLCRELGISTGASAATGMTLHHLAVLQNGLKPRVRAG